MNYQSFQPGGQEQNQVPISEASKSQNLNERLRPYKWHIAIAGGIIIALLFGAYSYLKYTNQQNDAAVAKQAQDTQNKIDEILQKRTQDPTAGWKTYNETLGAFNYEFKYPAEWPVPKHADEQVYSILLLGPPSVGGCEGTTCYTTSLSLTTTPLSFFGPGALETPEKVLADIKTVGGGTLLSDSIRNDGSRIIVHLGTGSGPSVLVDIFYPAVQRKLHALFIQRTESSEQLKAIANTFKFTDSVDTSTWKTYNSKLEPSLLFKYPADWSLVENAGDSTQESVQIKAPKTGQYWTIINWSASVDGLGGGCPADQPHAVIHAVETMPHVPGLYFVSVGAAGSSAEDTMAVVDGTVTGSANQYYGNPPKIGDTGSCLYYPLIKSKLDSTRKMGLTGSNIQPQDKATAKQILESLNY